MESLTIRADGAQLFSAALSASQWRDLAGVFGTQAGERAGVRLHGLSQLGASLGPRGRVGRIAASLLGADCLPVRGILFDKSSGTNWSLGWHQDRTIAVRRRVEVAGFGPWSLKSGMVHVEPPFELLARMFTLRVHLDDVPQTNAPLLIAPGSHQFGRIATPEIAEAVRRCGSVACLAKAGDVWAYSTPILHASDAAAEPVRRRVLQVDYSAEQLPAGLEWLGV